MIPWLVLCHMYVFFNFPGPTVSLLTCEKKEKKTDNDINMKKKGNRSFSWVCVTCIPSMGLSVYVCAFCMSLVSFFICYLLFFFLLAFITLLIIGGGLVHFQFCYILWYVFFLVSYCVYYSTRDVFNFFIYVISLYF